MSNTASLVTAHELEGMPAFEHGFELVEGRLVRMSPVGYDHGRVVLSLGSMLHAHVKRGGLGDVLTELGCQLASNPDTVRAPDLAFIRRERLEQKPRGFWRGAPDLVIEVLSPEDRPPAVRAKTGEYLTRGVLAVVVVDPHERTVQISRRLAPPIVLNADDALDLSGIVEGFTCRVGEIFE
jgi:Uma2 family endonuclease